MIGASGFARGGVDNIAGRVAGILGDLEAARANGKLPFYDLPYDEALRRRVAEQVRCVRGHVSRCVVLGIGGSALGTRAVLEAIPVDERCGGMEVEVVDNIDPLTVKRMLDRSDPQSTLFNVISKSGATAETMAQFLLVYRTMVERLGKKGAAEKFLFTTDAQEGELRAIAAAEGIATLPVPRGVGGRFSVLSAVGLFPIALAGIDTDALHKGAREADLCCRRDSVWKNPAALHAALLYLGSQERGWNIHVLMPYKDGLAGLAEWYGQLWAESLGKKAATDGTIVDSGQTPVRAVGATDQHSQVQLYVEGPRDKVVTFFRVEHHDPDLQIPEPRASQEAIGYLGGHRFGELLNMEQRATELALVRAQRPTSVISIDTLDTQALGFLFHMLEVQTLVMGGLLAVDPLDQPGVEAGKRLTQAMAGRRGLEKEAEEVRRWFERKQQDLVLG